ncbi:serine hydrolase FSH [Lentinula detonsa]|uniref:Serine hydrolase FSH n=1 Tax=Lentinula detonsa TaxID=2804962 RepID=A0A9W8P3V2_9AGAR|nr:serine hydrolase FSH [Lentinula detonsa]KAJ3978653.1 serine hydrolase FSH [Lentinula detonsa]
MSSPQKRVLCLHGYSQNANMFSKKLAALRQQLPEVELVFIDAPHVLQPVDLPAPSQMGYFSGFDSEPPPKDPQRGWWKTQNVQNIAAGLEVTLTLLRDVLKEQGVFNGVLGFSQGAVLAALLSGLLEKPAMYPSFLEDGKAVHPPFEFCISFAGYKPLDPLGAKLLTPNFKTPTLHVIGLNDIIVTPERAQSLIDASLNGRVELHDGGHFVPSKTAWRKFLAEYIRNPSDDVPGPNGKAPATNGSTLVSEPVTPILE